MKYIAEFRNPDYAKTLVNAIKREANANRCYHLMEFCGGHTHTIHRYGLPSLLPDNVEMIHGPGCPVCVLPIPRIDKAIALAKMPNVILCSYADMLRVPGSHRNSLIKAKAEGADVRMIYSVEDALTIAIDNPTKEVVFFAIGFETTTPPTAHAIQKASMLKLKNFSVFCNHVLTPVAMAALLQSSPEGVKIDGFVGPAHVSIVIGSDAYQSVSEKFQKPIVISGFEPLDVLHSILLLIRMINKNKYGIENQYVRAVTEKGNIISQAIVDEVLTLRDTFEWRGLGFIPNSALAIQAKYSAFDAEKRFQLPTTTGQEHKQCACVAILRGVKKPKDCKLFAKLCTPDNPIGSCMVSSEGACAAVYAYDRVSERI